MNAHERRKQELVEENETLRAEIAASCQELRPAADVLEQGFSVARLMVRARSVTQPIRRLWACGTWSQLPATLAGLFFRSKI